MTSSKRNLAAFCAFLCVALPSCFYPGAKDVLNKSPETFSPYAPGDTINVMNEGSVSELAVGSQHTCAIRSGNVYCWGLNDNGQIGNEDGGFIAGVTDPVTNESPAAKVVLRPVIVLRGAESIAVGFEHTCAVKSKSLYCWGSNTKGQLGLDTRVSANEPTLVSTSEQVIKVKARGYLTCAITVTGKALCFGSRFAKKTSGVIEPALISKTPQIFANDGVTQIGMSPAHICIVQNEALKCLGYNGWGEVGDAARVGEEVPSLFEVFNQKTTVLAATDARTCAIQDGKMMCVGMSLGDRAVDHTPAGKWKVSVSTPYEATFWNGVAPGIKISGSGAVLSSQNEFFYGSYFHNGGVPKKIAVQTHDFDFSERDQNGCFMFKNSAVKCWGANTYGQLGNGERTASESPVTQANDVSF